VAIPSFLTPALTDGDWRTCECSVGIPRPDDQRNNPTAATRATTRVLLIAQDLDKG